MNQLIVFAVGRFLRILGRIAPRRAGRFAFRMFCTPRFRGKVPGVVESVMEAAERLALEVEGQRIQAYHWPHPERGEEAPLVILVHGWESRAARLAVWVEPLRAAGFRVAAADAPAHGESEGKITSPRGFALALMALAEEVGAPAALVAHSVGGLASFLAVTAGELLGFYNLQPQRMVILAGAESGVDATAYFCRALGLPRSLHRRMLDAVVEVFGFSMAEFDAHRRAAEVTSPVLWLHDPEDPEVPFEGAQRVVRKSSRVQLETVPGLGHHRIARDPEIIARGVEFLAPILSAGEAGPVEEPAGV
ncbi:MAG: alpha/beta hydrolase [Acidobacteriota bacterium]|nr:alpha/beta hydrolase [Acidobacteriota bacterium]